MSKKIFTLIVLSLLAVGCATPRQERAEVQEAYSHAPAKSEKEIYAYIQKLLDSPNISNQERANFKAAVDKNFADREKISNSQRKYMVVLLENLDKYSLRKLKGIADKMRKLEHKKADLKLDLLYELKIFVKDQIADHEKAQALRQEMMRLAPVERI